MGCMNQCIGCACVMDSCKVVATSCSEVPSVPVSSSGHAHGMPRGPSVGAVLSMEVEPMFLARVSSSTWNASDVEMCKLACHAMRPHALFYVKQLHCYDLVFRGSGELARLVSTVYR